MAHEDEVFGQPENRNPLDEPHAHPAYRRLLNYMELDPILEEEGLSAREGYTYDEKLHSTKAVLQMLNKALLVLTGFLFTLKLAQLALFALAHHSENPKLFGYFVGGALLALGLLVASGAAVLLTRSSDFQSALRSVYAVSWVLVLLEVAFIIVSAVHTFKAALPSNHESSGEGDSEPSLLLEGPMIIAVAAFAHTVLMMFLSLHMLMCCLGFKFYADLEIETNPPPRKSQIEMQRGREVVRGEDQKSEMSVGVPQKPGDSHGVEF